MILAVILVLILVLMVILVVILEVFVAVGQVDKRQGGRCTRSKVADAKCEDDSVLCNVTQP